jgi:hypothetical protein
LCEQAALLAAEETGVPLTVLRAVALTETGRTIAGNSSGPSPWPWTVNQGGKGSWLDSRGEAVSQLNALLSDGARNVDIGCFQLNHRWHGHAFSSVDAMLDPVANALYAAGLLSRHHDALGNWSAAAGAYHSATPALAKRYRARFDAIYASANGSVPAAPTTPQLAFLEPRANRFPLLLAGGQGTGGSLFPAVAAGQRLIGD